MADYLVDKRDIEFVLFEQFDINSLTELAKYKEMNSELYEMILSEAIRFATEVLAPINSEADSEGCTLSGGEVSVPKVFKKAYGLFCEGGWGAVHHSPEFGGMGLPLAMSIITSEIFIGACPAFMLWGGLNSGAGHLVEAFATDWLKKLVTPKLYSGKWAGTMCLTEPQAGTAVGDLTTSAKPIEGSEGEYLITGNKIFITSGDHDLTENIIHMVLARVEGDAPGTKGISLFVVPKHRFDKNGKIGEFNDVHTTAIEHKMGINGSPTCALAFGDEGQCHGYLVGERSHGIRYMFQMMNEARIATGIQGAGAANASHQLALAYAKERIQGAKVTDRRPDAPKVAIIDHPDVRRNLMLTKSMSEGLRALLIEAAMYSDKAANHPDEKVRTTSQDMLELLTPICKAYSTDQGFRVTEIAVQLHGGYGYVNEYGVEQQLRDTKIASLYEGTNGVQALDLLGRKMRMKGGMVFMTWLQSINVFVGEHKTHPRLAAPIEALDKAKNALAGTAMALQTQGKADFEQALLGATPFLEMFGHVVVGRLLVEQAIIADAKLQAIIAEQGAEGDDAIKDLIASNTDARFYDGKIRSARFFIDTVVPHVRALGKSIEVGNRDALDMNFG